MSEYRNIRAIISGGGTGGHIFPALSIAQRLKLMNPATEILFVGAEGRMEMEKVPAAGYKIIGLPVAGLQRKLSWSNLILPFKVLRSRHKAEKIIKDFKPDIAIGVGGYASAPLLSAAQKKGIPTLIQEQNGFAGLTNKMLAKKADCICVAYEGMEKFFPADRIVLTGNPIRSSIVPADQKMKEEALAHFGLDPDKKHLLVVGGSLGSRTLNESMKKWISDGCPGGEDVEVMWQHGKYYREEIDAFMEGAKRSGLKTDGIRHSAFIDRMDLAYAAADAVISRSGASSVSELCAAHKAVIFVPSPNVAEDHQTHNAMALVRKEAALIVKDDKAVKDLLPEAMALLGNPDKIASLQKNIAALALPEASLSIAREVYRLCDKKKVK